MDAVIEINGLRLYAHHGVMPQENTVGNRFEVTAHLTYPVDDAIVNDDIASTLNYAEAIEVIKAEMSKPSRLLEHVAWRIAKALGERFGMIKSGSVQVKKLNPPCGSELDSTAVTLRW